jgi:hypothetical protein
MKFEIQPNICLSRTKYRARCRSYCLLLPPLLLLLLLLLLLAVAAAAVVAVGV